MSSTNSRKRFLPQGRRGCWRGVYFVSHRLGEGICPTRKGCSKACKECLKALIHPSHLRVTPLLSGVILWMSLLSFPSTEWVAVSTKKPRPPSGMISQGFWHVSVSCKYFLHKFNWQFHCRLSWISSSLLPSMVILLSLCIFPTASGWLIVQNLWAVGHHRDQGASWQYLDLDGVFGFDFCLFEGWKQGHQQDDRWACHYFSCVGGTGDHIHGNRTPLCRSSRVSLFADLCLPVVECSCSQTGTMEANGCAKPAVWKNTRRHFCCLFCLFIAAWRSHTRLHGWILLVFVE